MEEKELAYEAAEKLIHSIEGENKAAWPKALQKTPDRFSDAWDFWTSGYDSSEAALKDALTVFEEEGIGDGMIFQGSIPFFSLCEHHLTPFFGIVHFAYLPECLYSWGVEEKGWEAQHLITRIVGLSKIQRLVEIYSRRLQVQERLTNQIVSAFMEHIKPRGAGCVIRARHLCYSEDTEVLTENGFKRFEFLGEQEKVAQVHPDLGLIDFVVPDALVTDYYSGPMHYWHRKALDQLVTPEHRCIVASEWKYRVRGRDAFSAIQAKDADREWYVIPKAGIYDPGSQDTIFVSGMKVKEELFCKLMGWYLSEGSFTRYKGYPSITICQSEKSPHFGDLRDLVLPLGFKPHKLSQSDGGWQFTFNGRLCEYFSQFGNSFQKFIPSEIFHASLKSRRAFLQTYMWGDGYFMPDSCQMGSSSRSKRLSDDLQRLWITAGYSCRVTEVIQSGKPQYVVHVHVRKGMQPKSTGAVTKENREVGDYSGRVYCANVPSGALMLRRNGTTFVSGNCMESRGIQKMGITTTTSALWGIFKEDAEVRSEFFSFVRSADEGVRSL